MDKLVWHTEQRKISELKVFEQNPRVLTKKQKDQLQKSLEKFNLVEIPAINLDNTIIAGHQRISVMQLLGRGEEEIDVRVPNRALTEEEFKEYNVRSNKNTGEWDFDVLANIFENDVLLDIGFTELELGLDSKTEAKEDDFDIEKNLPEKAKTKLGDIYKLGEHRLLCGDATKRGDLEKLMNGKKANMLFTSPPYNIGKNSSLHGNKHLKDNKYDNYDDNKTQHEWGEIIRKSLSIAMEYSRYQFYNIQMLAGNKKEFLHLLGDYADKIADIAIWNKGHAAPAMAKNVMNSVFEFIIIFSSEYNPPRSIKIGDFRGTIKNIFDIPPQRSNDYAKINAATFPVLLPSEIINGMTDDKNIVLDNFIGTGTTLIACEQIGRICYGLELDERYCDVIVLRWEQLTGKKAELL